MQPTIYDDEPSTFFLNVLSGGGSSHATCQCGKEHFCPDADYGDIAEDESWTEYCEAEYKNDPENVMLHYGYDSVGTNEIDGKVYVYGCDCYNAGLKRYENWIWNNRKLIRDYLIARSTYEYDIAEQEKTLNLLLKEHA